MTRRSWLKTALIVAMVIAAALAALGGTASYFVLRHMESRTSGEVEALQAIDAVKARFGSRPPLIDIADPRKADIRIRRPSEPSAAPVDTIHVINWKNESRELSRADFPLWLMRFSSVNIASQLGLTPEQFRLTISDVERYGPGILVDYGSPGAFRILVWVE